jgi:serine/threonine protein kinase
MLEKNPSDRPTAAQALKHPWFSGDEAVLTDLLLYNNLFSKGREYT